MAEIKTKQTDASVHDFIESFANTEQKRKDSYKLLKIMQKVTGQKPKMWGPSIIGFGMYHYKSDKSSQQGDWPMVGFSPRKTAISLYVFMGTKKQIELLKSLGTYKMGKACIYIKTLSDINEQVLIEMMEESISFLKEKYGK